MFGKYEIVEQPVPGFFIKGFLGAGSFGSVWSATGPGGSEVAIKRINLQQYGDKELRALRLVKRIRHPNVVPLTGFWLRDQEGELIDDATVDRLYRSSVDIASTLVCADDGTRPAELIVVMGLADMSLEDRLRECQTQGQTGIPVDELLRYMDDAARAIDFLNKKQHRSDHGLVAIQHCDIKPQNILIVGGAAQLCDLGLARILDDARQTRAAFSAAYGAPECLTGSSPSAGTDQYSLAVSYVELRTGQLPFKDPSSHLSVIQAHVESRLDLTRLTPSERAVIRRATSKNPADRFQSVQAMVDALRQAVRTPVISPRRQSHRGVAIAITSLAIIIGGGLFAIGVLSQSPQWQLTVSQTMGKIRALASPATSHSPVAIESAADEPATDHPPTADRQPVPETAREETTDIPENTQAQTTEPADDTNESDEPPTISSERHEDEAPAFESVEADAITETPSRELDPLASVEQPNAATDETMDDPSDPPSDQREAANIAASVPTDASNATDTGNAPDATDATNVVHAGDQIADGPIEPTTDEPTLSTAESPEASAETPTLDFAAVRRTLGRRTASNVASMHAAGSFSFKQLHAFQQESEAWLLSQLEERARQSVERGRDEEAIALYTQLIQRDRDHLAARTQRGLAYVRMGKYIDAMNDYSQIIELDRSSADTADAYRLRGVARAKHGDLQGAAQDLTMAIDRGVVALAGSHRMRALVLLQQKHYADALQDAEALTQLDAKLLLVLPLRVKGSQVSAETEKGDKLSLEEGKPLRLLRAEDHRLLVSFQVEGREQQGWVDEWLVEPSVKF